MPGTLALHDGGLLPACWQAPPKTASSLLARGMLLEPVARGVSILRERYGDVFKLLMASVALLLLIPVIRRERLQNYTHSPSGSHSQKVGGTGGRLRGQRIWVRQEP